MENAAHREVGFVESATLFFKNYVNFKERSSRGAYWWWFLISLLISFVIGIIEGVLGGVDAAGYGPLSTVFSLATVIPGIALGVRRLHDTDRSGWWLLIGLIPIAGWIILIIFLAQPGKRHDTRFGPDVEAGRAIAPEDYARTFT